MRVVSADIWDVQFDDHWRVIPTNLGWRKDGVNVMGAGVAKQAAARYPELAAWYGSMCKQMLEFNNVILAACEEPKLIMFPVKPLDKIEPHLSWKQKAHPALIEYSLGLLSSETEPVVLPMVGCGNGQLAPSVVFPKIESLLTGDNFTVVMQSAMYKAYRRYIE